MRDPGLHELAGGQELVVGREERARAVQDADAAGGELAELGDPVVDAVERGLHVEPAEGHVAGFQPLDGLFGREDERLHARPGPRSERDVGLRRALGDEREDHAAAGV
jgi:hypothetical protein